MVPVKPVQRQAHAICDACVLINLSLINELRLLGAFQDFRFFVPQAVLDELLHESHRKEVRQALDKEWLRKATLDSEKEDALVQELRPLYGAGESACLAIAQARQWHVVTDESGALAAEIGRRVGSGRQIGTVAILVEAVRRKLLSVNQADAYKAKLEVHKFKIKIRSFADIQ